MKVHLKLKTDRGGYKFVRCCTCNEKRVFKSFKAAARYAQSQKSSNWKAMRIS